MIAPALTPDMAKERAQAEANFVREGLLMQEESRQGSDYRKFANQLKRTIAAFHLTEDAMRQTDERRGSRFETALDRWEATRSIWEMKTKGREYFTRGDRAWREALMSMGESVSEEADGPPLAIRLDPSDQPQDPHRSGAASLDKLVHLGLRKGEEAFQAAMVP